MDRKTTIDCLVLIGYCRASLEAMETKDIEAIYDQENRPSIEAGKQFLRHMFYRGHTDKNYGL